MSEPAVLSSRLIGEIFVERGLVTHQQLEEALVVQQRTGEMIGEVLVSTFGVSRIELASVLAEQWSAMERVAGDERPAKLPTPPVRLVEDSDAVDPDSRRPLGEIFVERGMATEEQLDEALALQRESGERLGEILVRMGVIQRLDLAGALAEQWAGLQKLRPPEPKPVEAWHDLAARPVTADALTNGTTDLPALQDAVTTIQRQLAALASRPDPDLTTLRAETRAVEQRLSGMEGRVDRLAGAEDLADLAKAVERLTAQAADEKAEDLAPVLAELTQRVSTLAADTALADRLAGLEQQVVDTGALRDELARLHDDVAQAARVGDLDDLKRRLDETAPGSLGIRVDELAEGLARLTERNEDRDAEPVHDPELVERVTEAQGALHDLSDRLGRLTERIDGVDADDGTDRDLLRTLEERVAAAVERTELEALATELQQRLARADEALLGLAEVQAELAARPTRDELTSSVREIAARIDDLGSPNDEGRAELLAASIAELATRIDAVEPVTQAAAGRTELAALAAELGAGIDELRREVARIDVEPAEDERVVSLVHAVGELGSRLEEFVGPAEVAQLEAELGARLDEVRSLAESSAGEDERVAPLIDAVTEIRSRVEESVARAELEALATELHDGLGELRRQTDQAVDHDRVTTLVDGVAELRSYLGVIQGRLDGAAGRAEVAALVNDLGARVDEVQALAQAATVEDRVAPVEGAVAELHGALDELRSRADGAVERSELEAVRQRLEDSAARAEVEGLAARLDARVDEVRALVAKSHGDDDRVGSLVDAVAELRSYVSAVRARLDGVVDRAEIDRFVSQLGAQMDEVRVLVESSQAEDRVAPVETALTEFREWLGTVQGRVDGAAERSAVDDLVAQLDPLRQRLEKSVGRAEVDELAARLDARVDEVWASVESSQVDDRVAPVEGAVAELREWLGSVQDRLGRAAPRSEVEGLVTQLDALRQRSEESVGRAEVAAIAGDLGVRVDEVRALVESSQVEDRVAPVEGAVAELRAWLGSVQGRLDGAAPRSEVEGLVAQLVALRERLDETVVRSEVDGLTVQLDALVGEVRALAGSSQVEDRVAPVEGAVAELRAWLGSVQGRLEGAAERSEVEGVETRLGHRMDEVAARADLRLAELTARDDELASGAKAAVKRVSGLVRDFEATAAESRGELEGRLAGLASGERLDRVEGELAERIQGLEHRVEAIPPAEALEALRDDLHQRITALDAVAQRAAAQAAGAGDFAASIVHEHLGELVGRDELAAVAGGLEARVVAAAASGADVSAQLAAGLDAIAVELREGLAHLHGRVDELAAGLGHTGGRLAAVEQTAANAAAVDELATGLAAVQAKVEVDASVSDERARATERAIRKGLASLGERLVAGEQAYLEAGTALRRSLERLGAAVVEADARIVGEPLDPPGVGYVAFVPTSDGYRLRPMDGTAPAVGELVELEHGEPPMRVGRVTVSPLPLDRRPCVYLEIV